MIKSYIAQGLIEVSGEPWLTSALLHQSLAGGQYALPEHWMLYLVDSKKFLASPWAGKSGHYLFMDYQSKAFFEFDAELGMVASEPAFPDCSSIYGNWYTSVAERWSPTNEGTTLIRNRLSGEEVVVAGQFELGYVCQSAAFGSLVTGKNKKSAAKIDLGSGKTIWCNREIANCGQFVDDEMFLVDRRGDSPGLSLCRLDSGVEERFLSFPDRPMRKGELQGSMLTYLLYDGHVARFDKSTREFTLVKLYSVEDEVDSVSSVDGDCVCLTNLDANRLRVYSVEKGECIWQGPLPELRNSRGMVQVQRCAGKYYLTVNDTSLWNHGCFSRCYVFELTDLEKDSPMYEHEELMAEYCRVPSTEEEMEYRIHFDEVLEFGLLLRKAYALAKGIGSEFGWTKHFEGNSWDRDFSGNIVLDLSNQRLDEKQRQHVNWLCRHVTDNLKTFYRAGVDKNRSITVYAQFARR